MIQKQKFILFTILILILIVVFCSKKEIFENNYFYSLDKSKEIMSDKKYFKFFNKKDLELRNLENINDYINTYKINTIDFSEDEKKNINEFINKFILKLSKYKNIFSNIKIIKVNDNIESGLPHTRNNAIVLSSSWLDLYLSMYLLDLNVDFAKLISHEQFHIIQRNNPKLFDEFYSKYWEMEKYDNLPEKLLNINRTNPDALPDNFWLFKIENNKYILPLCIYKQNTTSIKDTKNVYFNLIKKNNKFEFIDLDNEIKNPKLLSNNQEFKKYFGNEVSNNYHPNELSASLFELLVENNLENKKNYTNIPALVKLENFLQKKIDFII